MINMTLETEKFKIACRAFFPDCKFSDLDEKGPNIFMNEVEYAPGKHVCAILILSQPDKKQNKCVIFNKPVYKLAYEIDARSYATRENHYFTDELDKFTRKLKELKRVDV